jgi:hypothetical protein
MKMHEEALFSNYPIAYPYPINPVVWRYPGFSAIIVIRAIPFRITRRE